ncbi:uncharacterized protein HMPREF1541_05370 [Cyphellophora europaea CBS 101466]|uniref:Xylanolytic transcriptional activator regulatory domain-containing protein n=1 Tax=Cyphellophora europaea (strain CBS 101466) TaxID=1220924 RepID=W2RRQ4_CYPE1|nr:uncharacterized protein HMPREF1541_05370 [Cyphellophora europaea CBS 101466]ETN39147.1 hypothetical protein HMPREF1541_05370 [Cyphellophora europaea CBS 101466]
MARMRGVGPGEDVVASTALVEGFQHLSALESGVAGPLSTGTEPDLLEPFMGTQQDGSAKYGPTSIFTHVMRPDDSRGVVATSTSSACATTMNSFSIIPSCIALFFRYQYSTHMFIQRETFITDFNHWWAQGNTDLVWGSCTPSLVNAISAIGASSSEDEHVRAKAKHFYTRSLDRVMAEVLSSPTRCGVQTLLCLGTYAMGHNDISQAWLLSGMALRILQDLGLQHDPDRYAVDLSSDRLAKRESHRRLYWGCYANDKLFSLFLGRPLSMYDEDANVQISASAPQIPIFNNFLKAHNLEALLEPLPAVPRFSLVFNELIRLSSILHTIMKRFFAPSRPDFRAIEGGLAKAVSEFNTLLLAFHNNLPSEVRFRPLVPVSLVHDELSPRVASLHAIYHASRLSLNKPFLFLAARNKQRLANLDWAEQVLEICVDSTQTLVSLISRFKTQHRGLRMAPMIFVHAVLIAIAIAVESGGQMTAAAAHASQNSIDGHNGQWAELDSYKLPLYGFLGDMAPSWGLAAEARRKLEEFIWGDRGERCTEEARAQQNVELREGDGEVDADLPRQSLRIPETSQKQDAGQHDSNNGNGNSGNHLDDWANLIRQFELDHDLDAFEDVFRFSESFQD